MKPTFWQRMDLMARGLLPFSLTLVLVLLAVSPTRIPGLGAVAPWLPLMGVYYWSISRPELMRPAVAFGLGVFVDLLGGTPLGVNALVYLLVHAVVVSQRRFFLGKPFFIGWWAFGLVALGVAAIKWTAVSVLDGALLDIWPVLIAYGLTTTLYPVFGWLFAKLDVGVLREA